MENATLFLQTAIGVRDRITALYSISDINKIDQDKIFSKFANKQAQFLVIPHEKKLGLGHQQNDLILGCRFQEKLCDNSFQFLLSPEFINCYTFTAMESINPYPVGVEQGLSLILKEDEFVWVVEYTNTSNIQSTTGLRLTIHEPYTIPNLVDNSIEMVPGHSTTIALQQKNIERIDTPRSKCMPESWMNYQDYDSDSGFRSTSYSCILQCQTNLVWKKCGCTPDIIPDLYPLEAKESFQQCTFTNKSDISSLQKMILKMDCELKTIEDLKTIKNAGTHPPCVRECPWECKSIEYSTEISHSRWPVKTEVSRFLDKYVWEKPNKKNKDYRHILHSKYNGSYDNHYKKEDVLSFTDAMQISYKVFGKPNNITKITNEFVTKSRNKRIIPMVSPQHLNLDSVEEAEVKWVQDSFYRLNVFFKAPVVEVHKQVLNYGPADLGSSLGGILGLWAGISLITIIELLEFLCQLIKVMSHKVFTMGSMDTSSTRGETN